MKSSIIKTAAAIAVGIITGTGVVYAGPGPHINGPITTPSRPMNAMEKIEVGTTHLASETWSGSKAVARTAVHSPVIAYQTVRGERPLFPQKTVARERSHREQVALTGHSNRTQKPASKPSQNEPPPI